MAVTGDIPGITINLEELIGVRALVSQYYLDRIHAGSQVRAGTREARIRGRGMEYEETRAYVSGDDVRTMDWRVMARTGEAHTKIFSEEKERRYLLAVDLSSGMFFGTRSAFKSWAAAQVAAHIGWIASTGSGRIGGLVAAPEKHFEIKPGKSRLGLMAVFHQLCEAGDVELPQRGSDSRVNFLLDELLRVVKLGSIVHLISDFMGLDRRSEESLSTLSRHNEVFLHWIYDECETEAWAPGYYPLLLGSRRVMLQAGNAQANRWLAERQQAYCDEIETLSGRFNLPLNRICCNREITPQVLKIPANR